MLCNIGHMGNGIYNSASYNGKLYDKWQAMLRRCYSQKFQQMNPTYIGCSVDERWHNYQNFCMDILEMVGELDYCLDKDILVKGNKIYNKETCALVPVELNLMLTKANNIRGIYPIGVCKDGNKYRARVRVNKKVQKHLGLYTTPEEAFFAYKLAKETRLKDYVETHKDKLDPRIYTALLNYEVEIHD